MPDFDYKRYRMKESEIFINQIGYQLHDSKTVFISAAEKGEIKEFSVCKKSDKAAADETVFTGEFLAAPYDEESGGGYFTGDFSSLQTAGDYYITVGSKRSFDFKISDDVYDGVALSTLKYFTDSRCGQGICHTGIAEVYGSDKKKNVQGGWHDAGDYGRYVVAGAKTVMDLLLAYKKCPKHFSKFDLLGEVRFELEWMLQMQREDGAVYHKISCYHFCSFIMPQDEKDQLVLSPVSTAATADFAGCLAYAAGFFQDAGPAQDEAFAKALLDAAVKAQNYLFSHDDELYINPPEITTGGYGDRDVRDERYFALCSLFAATGEKNYLNQALKYREDKKHDKPDPKHPWNSGWQEGFGWPFVSGYGTEILLEVAAKDEAALSAELLAEIHSGIIAQAERYLETVNASAFRYCTKFVMWGSNGAICDLAHVLLMAYDLTGREDFKKAAKAQIDYILGCNPLNYCYITGEGTKSPVNPHHRPTGASKKVYPGMLAGGPCSGLIDAYAKQNLAGQPPLKCYADATPSYSTNEVAIYWNSAFVYVLSRIM